MTTSPESTQTPPAVARPRLERSKTDRYVGGVCGGLGRYFDIDPVIIRVAIACLAIFGAGLILYAIAWAFIPEEGQELSVALATRRDGAPGRELLVIGIVVLAGLAASDQVFGGHNFGDGGWLFPLFIIGGLLWWRRERRDHRAATTAHAWASPPGWVSPSGWAGPPAPPVPPVAPPAPSAFWAATATASPAASSSAPAAAATRPWGYEQPPPRPPRERSQLGVLTFSSALLALGIAATLDATGTISLSAQAVLAIALAVVGGGLLLGSWFGRSRGLIVLGLVLTMSLATVSALDLPLNGASGDVTWQLTRIDQLDDGYHLRAGTAVLDLTAVEFGAEPQTIDVSLGVGDLTVIVPEGVVTRVKGHLGLGDVTVFGRHQDGVGIDIDTVEPGTPQLTINARVGLADFKVRHEAS